LSVAVVVIWRRLKATGAPRLRSLAQTRCQQGIGQPLNASGKQSEYGRGFDDRKAGTGYVAFRTSVPGRTNHLQK
jgi:hypothetical protein